MTEEEKASLVEKIALEISKLNDDIKGLEAEVKGAETDDTDEITRMDSIVTKSMKDAALSAAKHRLAVLQHAATRVNSDDFGYCAECGDKIPLPRLMAMPESTYCVVCAEELS